MNLLGRPNLVIPWRLIAPVLLAAGTGCSQYYPPLRLFGPGPADYQRAKAVRYDPYPDPDAAPEVVGGRPVGFEQPVPEPKRAQDYGGRRSRW